MAATFTPSSVIATRPVTGRDRARATWRNMGLWTLQGWIAMFFIAAGYAKLTESIDNLTALMIWPGQVGEAVVRGLGVVEIVLAIGILAPLVSWKVGRPILMIAATGLALLEVVMLGVHAIGADLGLSLVNVFLLAITIPVLLGRRAR
ncbi:hypothetical protein BH10PSE2_BH10PSE2_13170 [soil metagenome]